MNTGERFIAATTADGKRTAFLGLPCFEAGERFVAADVVGGRIVLRACRTVSTGQRGIPAITADGHRTLVSLPRLFAYGPGLCAILDLSGNVLVEETYRGYRCARYKNSIAVVEGYGTGTATLRMLSADDLALQDLFSLRSNFRDLTFDPEGNIVSIHSDGTYVFAYMDPNGNQIYQFVGTVYVEKRTFDGDLIWSHQLASSSYSSAHYYGYSVVCDAAGDIFVGHMTQAGWQANAVHPPTRAVTKHRASDGAVIETSDANRACTQLRADRRNNVLYAMLVGGGVRKLETDLTSLSYTTGSYMLGQFTPQYLYTSGDIFVVSDASYSRRMYLHAAEDLTQRTELTASSTDQVSRGRVALRDACYAGYRANGAGAWKLAAFSPAGISVLSDLDSYPSDLLLLG